MVINMNARFIAFNLLVEWEKNKIEAESILEQAFSQKEISQKERAFLTELFYGVLRWLNQLDYIIDKFSHIRPKKISPEVRCLLRLGIYQLYHLHKVPVWAAIYETVEVAKKNLPPWTVSFINAILRQVAEKKEKIKFPKAKVSFIAIKYAHPQWLIKRWLKDFGEKNTILLCKFNNNPPPLVIRTNTLKISREELKKYLIDAGLKIKETAFSNDGLILSKLPFALSALPGFKEGWFFPQLEVSQMVTYILSPNPDEIVLDGCAGVGGKTTHIAQLMQNKGKIYAIEPNKERLKQLHLHIKRLQIKNVIVKPGYLEKVIFSFPKSYFDRIILDVPCSGLGVLRQNVDLKWRRKEKRMYSI